MKIKLIGYWATTAFLAFAVLSGGAAELAHRRDNVEGLVQLGYPVYFATIIGLWKVLGGLTVLVPRFPRLKEWAYAGIFFNMTGAAASHAASGDGVLSSAVFEDSPCERGSTASTRVTLEKRCNCSRRNHAGIRQPGIRMSAGASVLLPACK